MTETEAAVIVKLVDDLKARGVRSFKRGDLEFTFEREPPKHPERVPALSRLKAAERS